MKVIALAGLVGTVIPSIWMALYHGSPAFAKWWFEAPSFVELIRLLLWPTSLLLMADPLDQNVTLWIVSIALNALIYVMVVCVFLAPKLLSKPARS